MRGIFLLLVIAAALCGASYEGARFAAGRVVGPDHPGLGPASARFAFKGIPRLKAHPRGWIVSYPSTGNSTLGGAEVYVSPTGELLGTQPDDLASRMEEAERSRNEP
ncbi:MAG TPA: hypothetical protein VIG95_04960 [Gemmatimonadales bacterium]|jgi:hypothetical protein